MNWRSPGGKSGLAKMLMEEHGLSKRKAEKAVNTVFRSMAHALRRGEVLELPVGKIWASLRPAQRKRQVIQAFSNIADKKMFHRLAKAPERFIHFRPNPQLIERGPFPEVPPPPASAETLRKAEEVEQQFCALMQLQREMNLDEFKSLLASADQNLDRLNARLRQLLKEERKFNNLIVLCSTVRQMYWIRD